jgi:excisionase family DNA binding protein
MTLDLKDRLYTSSEVAEILGVSLRSVYRYLEEGKLDADIKTATGRHRFSKKNILDFLQPGGITKDQAEDQFSNSTNTDIDDEFDVLDLPAINKTKKNDESYDDFSFDLDEDFFKSLDFDAKPSQTNTFEEKNTDSTPKISNGDYIDDDLEKLLKEFEEKEGLNSDLEDFSFDSPKEEGKVNSNLNSSSNSFENDDLDFDLDSFFKELEEESDSNSSRQDTPKITTQAPAKELSKESSKDDFDFDFDLDFLNELTDEKPAQSKQEEVKPVISKNSFDDSVEEDSEDNWLERFRKAAQKNNSVSTSQPAEDTLNESFFDSSSLDHFFDNTDNNKPSATTLSNSGFEDLDVKIEKHKGNREYYYSSSLNGLKEIAQNIDKIAKKFDTDYAFTMNAGLSLHKPISPFTLIHSYVRGRDLELFEDYLNLTEVESPSEASVCLIVPGDLSVFEDSYELHGLYVVSNVQLRSDLIDKGFDKLAREI